MDTDSFIARVKTDDVYKDIAEDVETRFDTSHYKIDGPLPMGKNEHVIVLVKDELAGKITKIFVGLRAKTQSYLKDNDDKYEKAEGSKRCVIKRKLKFKDYKN